MTCSFRRAAAYTFLATFGGLIAWRAAPDVESFLFPVLIDERLVPFDPSRPTVLAELQLDRVCWRLHFRKARAVATRRWVITFIAPDGTRYFRGPLDGRTGQSFSSRNVYSYGFEGAVPVCAWLPDGLDTTQGFNIESYGEYEPAHHLWYIAHTSPIVHVPPSIGVEQ